MLKPGARFVNLDVSKAAESDLCGASSTSISTEPSRWSAGSSADRAKRTPIFRIRLRTIPTRRELRERFARAGFADAGYVPLMGGAIAVHYRHEAEAERGMIDELAEESDAQAS